MTEAHGPENRKNRLAAWCGSEWLALLGSTRRPLTRSLWLSSRDDKGPLMQPATDGGPISYPTGPMARDIHIDSVDGIPRPIIAISHDYPDGHAVKPHHHRRGQLISGASGVIVLSTADGTWVMPPQRGMWIPPATRASCADGRRRQRPEPLHRTRRNSWPAEPLPGRRHLTLHAGPHHGGFRRASRIRV